MLHCLQAAVSSLPKLGLEVSLDLVQVPKTISSIERQIGVQFVHVVQLLHA